MQAKYVYGLLFYMCHFIGVFPLLWNTTRVKNFPDMGGHFIVSGRGLACWILQLVVCAYCSFQTLTKPTAAPLSLHYLVLSLRLIQSFFVFSSLLLIMPFHTLKMCSSKALRVYYLRRVNKPISFTRFNILLISIIVSFLFSLIRMYDLKHHQLVFSFFQAYLFLISAASEVVISVLIFVAEISYKVVNLEMTMLFNCESNLTKLRHLKVLINHHNITSEYVQLLKDRFGLSFVNIFFCYTLLLLTLGLYTVTQIKLGVQIKPISLAFCCCYITFRLLFLTYHCHRLKEEGEMTAAILRKLQICTSEEFTEKDVLMLNTYHELVVAKDLQFTACDLFNVSIQQVISVLSVLMTLILAVMQVK